MDDDSTTTKQRRLRALLLIVAYAALCGVPVWWRTTSVPRPPLPHARMCALQEPGGGGAGPFALPVYLDVHVVLGGAEEDPAAAESLARDVEERVRAAAATTYRLSVGVSVVVGGSGERCARAGSSSSESPCLPRSLGARLLELEREGDAAEADALLLEALGGDGDEEGGAGRYALVVVANDKNPQPPTTATTLTIGKHRHAWVSLPAGKQALSSSAAEAATVALRRAFGLWAEGDEEDGGGSNDSAPASPLFSPGGLVLSFSLVNGDGAATATSTPCPGGYTWDFAALERARLTPVVRALRSAAGGGAATVGAESAVLRLSPAGAEGAWRRLMPPRDEDQEAEEKEQGVGAYVLSRRQLPAFADSEWPIESGRGVLSGAATMHRLRQRRRRRRGRGSGGRQSGGRDTDNRWALERDRSAALLAPHVLNFVTYVPPRGQRPLLVEGAAAEVASAAAMRRGAADAGNATTRQKQQPRLLDGLADPAVNGYWIPSWGGVFIWNPPPEDEEEEQRKASPSPRVCPLPDAATAAAARAFVTHLRALLSLPAHGTQPAAEPSTTTSHTAVRLLPSPEHGLAQWELDALRRRRVRAGAASAARTLRGLSEVVSELPNLGMPDLIGVQVAAALAAADAAREACARGDYEGAAVAASAAAGAADAAYLHPSVLSQLNFPDSHKLGVYMPYFLPASVPLIQGLAREARRWIRRRRKERVAAAAGAAAGAAAARPAPRQSGKTRRE